MGGGGEHMNSIYYLYVLAHSDTQLATLRRPLIEERDCDKDYI